MKHVGLEMLLKRVDEKYNIIKKMLIKLDEIMSYFEILIKFKYRSIRGK